MRTAVTFDELVKTLSLSSTKIVEVGNNILHGLSSLLGVNYPQDDKDQIGEQPKVVRTSFGDELGYLIHMSFFPRQLYSDSELAFIDYSDRRNKEIHKGEGRKMGSVYDSHPLDILKKHGEIASEIAPEVAAVTGLTLEQVLAMLWNPAIVISKKRHDDGEDDKELKNPLDDFKKAKSLAVKKDQTLKIATPEYNEMMRYKEIVKQERAKIFAEEYSQQNDFINGLGLNDAERQKLFLIGSYAMGIIDWSTRHIEENFFTGSIFRVSQTYTAEDYIKHSRGGPFQAKLMKILGIKDQQLESRDYYLARIYLRTLDRLVLSQERKPRYVKWQAREWEGLFSNNQWLRELYGELGNGQDGIRFRVDEEMSRPEFLDMLYRNYVVLSNIDRALSRYGKDIARQQKINPLAYGYMLAILKARENILAENYVKAGGEYEGSSIIAELKRSYKKDLGKKAKEIEDYVASLPAQEFDMVTGKGPISNGFRYETGMDVNKEDTERQIVGNYDDVLCFERLHKNFLDPQRNKIDIRSGKFELFVIKGLRDGISFNLHPTPYRR